ncbi:MAG: winged helix-turn-helix domain-containing protein [Halosimplex sp.]
MADGDDVPGDDERLDSDPTAETPSRGGVVERLSADDAFELLGNEARLDIVRALFDADGERSFSALREAVGVRDSGQFNYHLEKLVGSFVRKTDDGYGLTRAGSQVAGSILAGQYTKTVEGDPVPVDADCPYCEGPLVARFDDDLVRVACDDCERAVIGLPVPPGAFEDYPRSEWPAVAERWTRGAFESAERGFCRTCHGPVRSEVEVDPDGVFEPFDAAVRYICQRCGAEVRASAGASVLFAPAVVAFYHERGVDVSETPMWEFDWAVRPSASVVSEDPVRVEVAVEHEGARLVLTLDGKGDVVGERRE